MNSAKLIERIRTPMVAHAAGVTLVAVVLGSFVQFVNRPMQRRHSAATREAQQLAELIRQDDKMFAQLADLKQDFAIAENRAHAIRQRIPGNRQEAELLAQLSKVAAKHQLTIVDYRRGEIAETEQFARFQIVLQCEGSFLAICTFVDEIKQMPRLTTVDRLQVQAAEDESRYPVNLTIALYYRQDEVSLRRQAGMRSLAISAEVSQAR